MWIRISVDCLLLCEVNGFSAYGVYKSYVHQYFLHMYYTCCLYVIWNADAEIKYMYFEM